jgi:lipid II:glycine glycyltransferase (peptidoglycan interpeptide bridge formation enzyme)
MNVIDIDTGGPAGARFEKFLAENGEGLFQSTAWAEAKVEEGWRAWPLAAMEGEEIRAGLIALERACPGPLAALGGLWYVPRGPVARLETPEGRAAAARLLDALALRARARRAVSIRIAPDAPAGTFPPGWMESLGYTRAHDAPWLHTATFRVDLARDDGAILAGMEGRARTAIRRAREAGITVDAANGPESVAIFHRMLRSTGERNRFAVVSEARVRALWERSAVGSWGRIFLSRSAAGEPLTGAFVLAPGRRCHYLFGASAPACRKLHPNELLHFEVMRWARARGCADYDLGGVAGRVGPDHPLWGNYLFKRSFGGAFVALEGEFEQVRRPRMNGVIRWAIARSRAPWAREPASTRSRT